VNLATELASALEAAFEGITGNRPAIDHTPAAPGDCAFRWRQPFTALPGALWIVAAEADVLAGGTCVVNAAEIVEDDPATLKSQFVDILKQAFAVVAQAFSGVVGGVIRCEEGQEQASMPSDLHWTRFAIKLGDSTLTLFGGAEPELMSALSIPKDAPHTVSKTFDLLLDVELPVSVSFGRAQVALKDVLKLTTGSIVELNRAIGDPVEVIVNDCVIARGEVVTIDGNFGVRIQEVISRQERLRNLK
jgi:flagellar motor switch protein FliN/FliY